MEKQAVIQAKTIITSHVNSDYDAIGAMLAAQLLYPDAMIIFPGSQEKNLRNFFVSSMSYMFNMASLDEIDESKIETIVLVDTRQKNRVPHVAHLMDKDDVRLHVYDHHPPQGEDICADFMEYKAYGATTTILCEHLVEKKIVPSPEEATVMALGIYEDTGSFTHASTTPQDFTQAAFLLSAGANLSTVASMVVKEIKSEHVTWLNELLTEMRSHSINGTDVHISSISSPTYIQDLATIVQKIMRMENLDIFIVIARMGNKISLIGRNKIPEVNVGKVMSSFGGGGHAYAASATVDDLTLAQTEHLLVKRLEKELKRIQVARTLMASPAITVDPSVSCEKAGELMTRYNISSLLVVEQKTNSYQGYITRRVVEKILYHQLKKQPVEEYMHSKTGFVSPDATMAEIDQKLIEEKHRIIPVIDDGWIKGVITQTDLLNYLVQHNKASLQTDTQMMDPSHAKTRDVAKIMNQQLDFHLLALLENIGKAGAEFGVNTYAVGGFVRDLMLHRIIDDIDIVVEGDGIAFAKYFAKKMGCRANPHKKFGTAVIIFDDNFKVDVASARLEYYTNPAALPIVEQSSLKMDLARRDFTINTLAIALNPDTFGTLVDYFGASRDLKDKAIRILHNLSFVEDPTRVFRAIKFSNRFGFRIGKLTSKLIHNALKIDCFRHLSGLRVLSELKQIFQEENPIPAIRSLESYGLEKIIHPQLNIIPASYELFESVNKALAWHDLLYVDDDYPRWAVYFMALLNKHPHRVSQKICERLKMSEAETQLVIRLRYKAENRLKLIEKTSPLNNQELYWGLINFKTESIIYMMALTKNEEIKKAISQFYTHHRHIKPILQGRDLIQLGIKPGPIFSKILNLIIDKKLESDLPDKDAELDFAKAYARDNHLI